MEACEQLELWVDGKSVHNTETDECCPDFSCCNGGEMANKETRERFSQAYKDGDATTQNEMLMMFLGEVFADKNIYVAGGSHNPEC